MDHQPRPSICPKKGARDRLIRLVATRPDWALGFEDETWFSRLARPSLHTWAEAGQPLRLIEQSVPKNDPDPKALACYGLLVQWQPPEGTPQEEVWLRFVDGRPVSGVTTGFLAWVCGKLAALGKRALLLVWDNASWLMCQEANRQVKREGTGYGFCPAPCPPKARGATPSNLAGSMPMPALSSSMLG